MAENNLPKKRNRNRLKEFYGIKKEDTADKTTDINSDQFHSDVYMKDLLGKKHLHELLGHQTTLLKEIRTLDSEMQTLVYENYNKFISATDTIRRMKDDFKHMEDQMEAVMGNMDSISNFSNDISVNLSDSRQKITKLSSVHNLLTKLQTLFELPTLLRKAIQMGAYPQAVKYYSQAAAILSQYEHVNSFDGIRDDCENTVKLLIQALKETLSNPEITAAQVVETTDMLVELKVPAADVIQLYLETAHLTLQADIDAVGSPSEDQDILEFLDTTGYAFLGSVSLSISTYKTAFCENPNVTLPAAELEEMLSEFAYQHFSAYFQHMQSRFTKETRGPDNALLVRGLDRFYRRLQPVHTLLPSASLDRIASEIVTNTIRCRIQYFSDTLHNHYSETVSDVKQSLLVSQPPQFEGQNTLADIMSTMKASLVGKLKLVLVNVKEFISADITFANKPYFRGPFCVHDIKQGLVLKYVEHILNHISTLGDNQPPSLLLVTARLCLEFETYTISYLSTLTEEMFPPDQSAVPEQLTPTVSELTTLAHDTVQQVLTRYVNVKGLSISQMIHTSVKTRDWLGAVEPRNVRAAMKRVVEEITDLDTQIGSLFEEGALRGPNSDSSRRAHSHNGSRIASSKYKYTPSDTESSLLNKLFNDQVEIFGNIQFTKLSILTGIIKIGLKAFLESVRLRTFGKYGLQQVQVDVYYLREYLWRFVEEERLLNFLLEEVISSAVDRCIDPVTMEPSVIMLLCEPS
ncbi:hypothetical protein ACHWQZ_G014210 [Mnemiopsis leidyi]